MARHIRVPGIVDVVLVSDPAEIRALNDHAKIDRNFIPRGPLINRLIVGRIRHWFKIMGQFLPSLLPRGDHVRADRQQELATSLNPANGATLWSEDQLDALAAYVRGSGDDDAAGILTQQIVGRLFDPQYRADLATWNSPSDRPISRRLFARANRLATHRKTSARAVLVERVKRIAGRARHTIGVHGIVRPWRGCGSYAPGRLQNPKRRRRPVAMLGAIKRVRAPSKPHSRRRW
jgi:hypothetical protein